MAILQSVLVEPLLSRQQSAVIRNIACVAQLTEALKMLDNTESTMVPRLNAKANSLSPEVTLRIRDYLHAEIIRVLMQIKVPVTSTVQSGADTTTPALKADK